VDSGDCGQGFRLIADSDLEEKNDIAVRSAPIRRLRMISATGATDVIVDAWMQFPNRQFLLDPMFEALRRWRCHWRTLAKISSPMMRFQPWCRRAFPK
jgi:hypothetical protein